MLISILPSLLIDGTETLTRRKRSKSSVYTLERKGESYDFTILIPAYNEEKRITKSLSSIERYKSKTIVVDDGSKDNTALIAKNLGFEVIRVQNGKKIGAIKSGLESINSKSTIILDADSRVKSPEKIPKLVQALFDEKLVAAAVQILPDINENSSVLQKLQYIEYKIAMEIGRKSTYDSVICISGAFGAYRTKELKEVTEIQAKKPMFEGDDLERTLLLLERGKVGYFPDFVVYTSVPRNLKELTNQRIKWQYGFLDKHIKFRKLLKRKDKVGAQFLYNYILNIGLHPFKMASLPFLLINPLDIIILYSLYATLSGYLFRSISSYDEWKKLRKYILFYPLYSLYNILLPTTIGYVKKFRDIKN